MATKVVKVEKIQEAKPDLWTPEILSYVAALIDSSSLVIAKRRGNRIGQMDCYVKMLFKDKDLLKWFQYHFGGAAHHIITSDFLNGSLCKPFYAGQSLITGKRVTIVLEAVMPFLKTKQKDAQILIEFAKTIGRAYRPTLDNILQLREHLYDELQKIRQTRNDSYNLMRAQFIRDKQTQYNKRDNPQSEDDLIESLF